MSIAVIIVAAGRGRRLGGEIPKQYLALGDSCSIRLAIEAFLCVPDVTALVPVIHPIDRGLYCDALTGLIGRTGPIGRTGLTGRTDPRLLEPVMGGDTRAASVRNGLERLAGEGPELVLIHDAARPFIPLGVIQGVIEALADSDGACAALPVVDALWQADGDTAMAPVPRDGLWRAQTPQGFHFAKILAAHRAHDGSGSDDVAVAREAGLQVTLVPGSEQNYKITTAADLERARRELPLMANRSG